MDEIPFEKSIKSAKNLPEYRSATDFLDFPDAENFIEYRYAKGFLNHPENLKLTQMSLAEMVASVYKTLRPEESFPSYLIKDSEKAKWAWDALNLMAQDRIREGKPLPPELAAWVVDVLADQLVEEGQERRPRQGTEPRDLHPRDLLLCMLVDQLRCLFGLCAMRSYSAPPRSACDVVAAAQGLSYKRVEDIWNERDPVLKPLFSSWNKPELLKKFCPGEIQNPPGRS